MKKKKAINDFFLINDIKKKYNSLSDKKDLTIQQETEIKTFYKDLLNEDVPTIYHKFYYSCSGVFKKEYLPTTVLRKLERLANTCEYRNAYADKNMLDTILPNAKHPNIFMKNMNGYYYVNNKPVSHDDAIKLCYNLGKVIIKPTLSYHGVDVRIVTIKNGITDYNGLTLSDLFKLYKSNYCIQEVIKQHEDMKILNPSSVNTIRVLTYRSDMEVLVLCTTIRIGRKNSVVDNVSSGGMTALIYPNGTIGKYAYSSPTEGQIAKTDEGITLDGHKIPSYDKAVKLVQEQHFNLPFFDIIGWDVAIREDGEPIIIEFNVLPDLTQSAAGPAFGEYTERVIREILNKNKKISNNE